MLQFNKLHAKCTEDHLGAIPFFFMDSDPRPAVEQIDERYAHGGGWCDLKVGPKGFVFRDDGALAYPGDPALPALAEAILHGPFTVGPVTDEAPTTRHPPERIVVHAGAFVSIHQLDGSFRVSRLD